jgi:hypothetical protein
MNDYVKKSRFGSLVADRAITLSDKYRLPLRARIAYRINVVE